MFPGRYQSDKVDLADGPIVSCANRRLRAAIMTVADNLVTAGDHFRGLASLWKTRGKSPGTAPVAAACRFTRIAFHMVARSQVYNHPAVRGRDYILEKLTAFHREHKTPMAEVMRQLQNAAGVVPRQERAAEAAPLQALLEQSQNSKRRKGGLMEIGQILPAVLARLGVGEIQSEESEDQSPG